MDLRTTNIPTVGKGSRPSLAVRPSSRSSVVAAR
jgi:hypothetical protein